MRKILLIWLACFVASMTAIGLSQNPTVVVTGGAHRAVALEPERSSGLSALFVVDSSGGEPLTATYTPATPGASVAWSRFSSSGAGHEELIEGATDYTLTSLRPDMGYIVKEGNRQYCFWITDYATAPLEVSALEIGSSECVTISLIPEGRGERLSYYSVNGRNIEIDREIAVTYTTLSFNNETGIYQPSEATEHFSYLRPELHLRAPLASTRFILTGDRFLRAWGDPVEVESELVEPTAVEATVVALQSDADKPDNLIDSDGESDRLGGSAPVDIEFSAAVTDAAVFTEWQFASDPEFTEIGLRFTEPVITYSFRESGMTFVRFVAANAAGTCEYISDTFEVSVGESELKCPNAFSPGTSEGQNDEWRVSYRSIIEFDCHIVDRSGRNVAHLTDPAQGWDGRIGGKLAPAGVYYYIIKALGSDGHRYNLSGDINIIRYR